ncbi:MAG TPA: hypothetical protein VFY30_00370 [Solirubrobacterales bacterium]|nr:hypothetical protein [Solirubrobacterales bacterium]
MGHANIETTIKYAHHIPKAEAAAQLSELIESERKALPYHDPVPRSGATKMD